MRPHYLLLICLLGCRPTYNPHRNYKLSQYYEHKAAVLQCEQDCLRAGNQKGWEVYYWIDMDSSRKFQELSDYYNPWTDPRPKKPAKPPPPLCQCGQ